MAPISGVGMSLKVHGSWKQSIANMQITTSGETLPHASPEEALSIRLPNVKKRTKPDPKSKQTWSKNRINYGNSSLS